MNYSNRTYAIVKLTDINKIDFSQIGETSASTIRKSIDDTQFVIKWNGGYTPTFIENESVIPDGTYTHAEALALMSTPAWSQDPE